MSSRLDNQSRATLEGLEDQSYAPIPIDGAEFNPFDTEAINRALLPAGWFTVAAWRTLDPTFFPGRPAQRRTARRLPVLSPTMSMPATSPPTRHDAGARCLSGANRCAHAVGKNRGMELEKERQRHGRSLDHYDFEQDFTAAWNR